MGLGAKAGFAGIVTSVGEVTAPNGALLVADNVTLRREQALECRESYAPTQLLFREYRAVVPYRGSYLYIGANNAVYGTTQVELPYPPNQGAAMPAVRDDITSAREARNNLYVASASGVFKVSAPTDTQLRNSGVSPTAVSIGAASSVNTGAAFYLLAENQHVAYRIVAKYVDPNGVIIRSRPTGAVIVAAGAGVGLTWAPRLSMYYRSYPGTGTLEIYRSRVFPTTAQPDDEMALVGSIPLPANTGGTVTWTDTVPEFQRGTVLYTSPSRGGIENANDRAPGCAVVERFKGCLFFGNLRGPQRLIVSYRSGGVRTGQTSGIGERVATGNRTSGQSVYTSVSSTTGVRVGMRVVDQLLGSGGTVTAVTANTVTVSSPFPSSATGVNLYFEDTLQINTNIPVILGAGGPNGGTKTTSAALGNTGGSMESFTAYELTPANPGFDTTLVIESVARGVAPFSLRASHGEEMDPPVPLSTAATGLQSTSDDLPHGLAWSEPDEPEHVPPRNYARVGDAGKAILGLVAMRDSLLIFKEDGLFRLSGATPSTFRIDSLDPTCICVLPGGIRRLRNVVYCLTTQGLAAISEDSGVLVISRPIQNELASIITAIRAAQRTTGLYRMPGINGLSAAVDEPNGEYLLALGDTTPSFGGQVLVWAMGAGGFTTYTFAGVEPVALGQSSDGLPIVLTEAMQLEPTSQRLELVARVQPHGFCSPELMNKVWTHVVLGFSKLTSTTRVDVSYTSAAPMIDTADAERTEVIKAPTAGGVVQLPGGTLLKHPIPRAHQRAWSLRVETTLYVHNGTFVLELVGAESRADAPNRLPTHGTGGT